jgi:hypothetical protein
VAAAAVWAIGRVDGLVGRAMAWIGRIGCGLLVLHHVTVYGANLRYLRDETSKVNDPWFNRFGDPRQSIRAWAHDRVLQNKPLDCRQAASCRFSEIYPAIAMHLESNGYGEPPIFAIDPASGRVIQLDVQLWETRALAH